MKASPQTLKALEELDFEVSTFYGQLSPGEQFHPDYLKDKRQFRKLVKTELKLERELKRYFVGASERAEKWVNWVEYELRARTTAPTLALDERSKAEMDRILGVELIIPFLDEESLFLAVLIEEAIGDGFEIGAAATEADLKISVGFTKESVPALDFIKKHALRVSKNITKTTLNRTKKSVLTSVDLGEDVETATARLQRVIKDPVRAEMISRTETVNAYSEGRLAVGKELNAKTKTWRDGQGGACEICQGLNGKTIPFNKTWRVPWGEIDAPPAHPNCRCGFKLGL